MNGLRSSWLRRIPLTRLIRPGLAIGIVGMGAFALQASGTLADADAALVAMGFDPERARLISALSIEALLVATAVLATGMVRPPMVAGLVSFAFLFRRAFTKETADAVAASGAAGRFDPTGWLLSLATLVITAVVIAWARGGRKPGFAIKPHRKMRRCCPFWPSWSGVLARLLVISGQDDGPRDLEILVLRHQLRVLRRTNGAPKFRVVDRVFLAVASRSIPRTAGPPSASLRRRFSGGIASS